MRKQIRAAESAITLLVFATLLLVSASAAYGQAAGAGTITGTILDQQSAVVPEATITVHNVETNVDRTFTSNGAGLYTAPFLQPGHYDITVNKTGFAKVARKDLTLTVGQTCTAWIRSRNSRSRRATTAPNLVRRRGA